MAKTSEEQDSRMPDAGLPHFPRLYGVKPRKQYMPWEQARQRLVDARNYWIASAGQDGRPHVMPVWGFWIDDALYFGTGRSTRKWRNMAANPQVVVHLESADDVVVVEGVVEEITDAAQIASLRAPSEKKYGMWMPPMKDSVCAVVRPKSAIGWTYDDFPKTATRWVWA